jgi:hypothetical protein
MKTLLFTTASLLVAAPAFAYCPPPMSGDNGPPGRGHGYYVGSECASKPWRYDPGSPIVSGAWTSLYGPAHGVTASNATAGPVTN